MIGKRDFVALIGSSRLEYEIERECQCLKQIRVRPTASYHSNFFPIKLLFLVYLYNYIRKTTSH